MTLSALIMDKGCALCKPVLLVLATALLGACAGSGEPPKPADLGPNVSLMGVRLAWTNQAGPVAMPLLVKAAGITVAVAASDGLVALLDARTGQDIWRTQVGNPISAAVGSDGRYVAAFPPLEDARWKLTLEDDSRAWRLTGTWVPGVDTATLGEEK